MNVRDPLDDYSADQIRDAVGARQGEVYVGRFEETAGELCLEHLQFRPCNGCAVDRGLTTASKQWKPKSKHSSYRRMFYDC